MPLKEVSNFYYAAIIQQQHRMDHKESKWKQTRYIHTETCETTFSSCSTPEKCSRQEKEKFSTMFCSFQIANNPCANLLTAHFRLDGHPNVNYLEKVIQNAAQSYLFFEPSQVVTAIK